MDILADGEYRIDDEIDIGGDGISNFIFGRGWLLEIIELSKGDFFFYSDDKEVRSTTTRFGAFYPSFTIVRPHVRNVKGRVSGFGAVRSVPELPQTPFIFDTDFDGILVNVDHVIRILAASPDRRSIVINSKPSFLSIKAKRLIDENYLAYPSISRIASRLGVSPEHLSRQFKRDYYMSPSAYLHQLRVSEATFRLSIGEKIIDISNEVGYNDLSRFYKQFRKRTKTSPAECRTMLKKPA
jgi:AraC-like DNA-binding protein